MKGFGFSCGFIIEKEELKGAANKGRFLVTPSKLKQRAYLVFLLKRGKKDKNSRIEPPYGAVLAALPLTQVKFHNCNQLF